MLPLSTTCRSVGFRSYQPTLKVSKRTLTIYDGLEAIGTLAFFAAVLGVWSVVTFTFIALSEKKIPVKKISSGDEKQRLIRDDERKTVLKTIAVNALIRKRTGSE